jgi:hypothetical protein
VNARPIAFALTLLIPLVVQFVACGDDDSKPPAATVDAAPGVDVTTSDVTSSGETGSGDTGVTDASDGSSFGGECRSSGWCWENSVPWGDEVTAVFGTAANDVWACGYAGALFHYDGTKWSRAASPTTYTIQGIWGAATNDLWAVGDHALLLHYDGTNWTVHATVDAGAAYSLHSIHGVAANDIWAVGDNNAILHYDGANWSVRPVTLEGGPAYISGFSVFAHAANDVWIGGSSGTPLIRWTGAGWVAEPIVTDSGLAFMTANAVWVAPNGDVFVSGSDGVVSSMLRRAGATWTKTIAPTGSYPSIWGSSASDVWAVGSNGQMMHFDGASFTPSNGPHNARLLGINGAGSDAWIVGGGATFLHRTAATTWEQVVNVTSVTRKNLVDVSAISADEAWAVGSTAVHRTAQGWAVANALDDGGVIDDYTLNGVSALAGNDVWASGTGGAFHWDGGKWSRKSNTADGGTLGSFREISATNPTDVWAVDGNSVYHWSGASWSLVPVTQADGGAISAPFYFTIVARSSTDVWAAGPFTVVHYDGAHWSKVNEADAGAVVNGPIAGLAAPAANDVWAVTGFSSGHTFRWTGGPGFADFTVPGDWADGMFFAQLGAASTSDVWLAATGGIAHFDGAAWSFSDRPTAALRSVSAIGGHAWVVGDDGAILHHGP